MECSLLITVTYNLVHNFYKSTKAMTNWINKLGLFVFRGNDSFPGLPSSQTKVFNSQVSSNRVMMDESMWITRGSLTMGFPSHWITWSSDVKFGSLFLPVKQFNPVVLSLILFLLCWIVSFLVESLLFCFLPASFFVVLCLVVFLLLLNSLPNVVLSPLTPLVE